MLYDKRLLGFLCFVAFVIVSIRIGTSWQNKKVFIFFVDHLELISSCKIDEVRLHWQGELLDGPLPPYLQGVAASTLNTNVDSPGKDIWDRDFRLYYWFMAQSAVKNNLYGDSLIYLNSADVGKMIDAAGHNNPSPICRMINWTLASEIGYRDPPDEYVQAMRDTDQWDAIEQAFTHLLKYDPQRTAWRLTLAEAYMVLEKRSSAEMVLVPVFLNGTDEEIEAANTVLQISK